MKYPLEVGVLTGPVTVGFVEKPDMVWLSQDIPREKLMDKLEETDKLKKMDKVETGSVAATIFSEDGALYRVAVLGVDGEEAELRYCDYGNMEKKVLGELFKLPDDLAKQEQLAVKVRVEGVKGVADSSKNRARVEKKLSVEGLMVKVVEDEGGLVGSFEVGGKKIKFSKNKEPGTAEESKTEVKQEKKETVEAKAEKLKVNSSEGNVDAKVKSCKESTRDKVVPNVEKSSQAEPNELKSKTEENEMVSKVNENDDNDASQAPTQEVKVTAVKVPVSTGKLVLFSQLPNLKLLEGVEISGTVVFVSPLGRVWFCPQWIQVSLDKMTVQVDALDAEKKLKKLKTMNLQEGIVCITRSVQDGELYRARVVTIDKKVTVDYIDFGNTEVVGVEDVYELPSGLEMIAPASAEVLLARDLPKQKTQEVLEETLMEVENLVLVLEKDKTGARVGKFYVNGKEIKWDLMVETRKVFEKENVDEENNDDEEDVVIESEATLKEEEVKKTLVNEVVTIKKSEVKEAVKPKKPEVKEVVKMKKSDVEEVVKMGNPEAVMMKTPVSKCPAVEVLPVLKESPAKLIRMVPPIPLDVGQDVAVFLVHVESAKKIWVCREVDEVRVSLLMDKLARMGEGLKPAKRMKKGAVYGARFSQDGEMYRVVLEEAAEEGRVVVLFIDFGNMETKEEKELYDIPQEIGTEPAAAVGVSVKNDLEETEDNRAVVEEMLDGEILTVAVIEDAVMFKVGGKEVVFNQAVANTSNTTTASEEMVTMEDIKQRTEPILSFKEDQQPSVPAVVRSAEVQTVETKSLVSPMVASTKTTAVEPKSEVPSQARTNPLPASSAPPVLIPQTKQPIISGRPRPAPVVSIPAPSVPQPVPTRTFAKAISALQSQLSARPRTSTGGSKKTVEVVAKEVAYPWSAGDKVVARWPDGVWRQAIVTKLVGGQVNVVSEGFEEVGVALVNVRPHSLPVEALNLIDQGFGSNAIVRQKGDGACLEKKGVTPTVVGKVKEWMDKNMNQLTLGGASSTELDVEEPMSMSPPLQSTSKQSLEQVPLPPSQDLAGYSRTSKGSLHIQSILTSTNPQLSSHILSSLLTGSPGPLSLMTSPKSSYVFQKLITVTPSPQLQPLLSIILSYFTQLSLDSSGCRVVQSMLEFSSPDQQRSITSLLCNSKTLLTMASDKHGTYVAQACLLHLTPNPTALLALVNSLLGYTAMLGQHQCGTFFLQRLVGVLSTRYPGSGAACLLQEDILANLSQLSITEPGSRLVQAMLKDSQPTTVVRVARWVVENVKAVIVTKPAVYVAGAVLEQIIERLDEEGSWTSLLDMVVHGFIGPDKESSQRQSILLTAALHPVGHLLAREVVAKVNYMPEEMKMDVMRVLASEVDRLSMDKFGCIVLKGLAESVI